MSVRVLCPSCQTPHGIAERLLGKRISCPNCQAPIQMPSREAWEQAQELKRARKAAAVNTLAISTAKAVPAEIDETESIPEALPIGESADLSVPSAIPLATVQPDAPKQTKPAPAEDEDLPYEKPKNRDTTEMDMTPMIDVTFLLLIFFVVTASFQIQKAMEVPKSKSDAPSAKSDPTPQDQIDEITIQIDSNNTFMVLLPDGEHEVMGKQNLISTLKEARGGFDTDAPLRLVIKAHVDSKHRSVVDALDAGAEVRFTELQLMEVEEFD